MHILILPLRHQALVCVWSLNLSPASHLARRRWYRRDGYGGQGVGRQAAAAQEAEVSGCLNSVLGGGQEVPAPSTGSRAMNRPNITLGALRDQPSVYHFLSNDYLLPV